MQNSDDPAATDALITRLVLDVAPPERLARLDTGTQRVLQGLVTMKFVLAQGKLTGTPAIKEAVRLCKLTKLGAGWFLRNRLVPRLASALLKKMPGVTRENINAPDGLAKACDVCIGEIVPKT